MTASTQKIEYGLYTVLNERDEPVGQAYRISRRGRWHGRLSESGDPVSRFTYATLEEAADAVVRAAERGGDQLVVIQPAPRIDNLVDGEALTQLPYPLHVRSHNGLVLDDWADRVIGFQRDLHVQRLDLRWHDLVSTDLSFAVGMYIVIQQGEQWSTLDTAVQSIEVKG